jgi:hypothetical protein
MWTVSYRGIWQLHLAETAASLVGSAPLVPGFHRARLHLGAMLKVLKLKFIIAVIINIVLLKYKVNCLIFAHHTLASY